MISGASAQDTNLETEQSMPTVTENDGIRIAQTSHETVGTPTASRKRISPGQIEQATGKSSAVHSQDERLIKKKKRQKV
jgi:hypothetical protein